MAYDVNALALHKVMRISNFHTGTGAMLWSLTQVKDFSMNITMENEVVISAADGTPIMKFENGKTCKATGTNALFVTQKAGTIHFIDTATRQRGTVTGVPAVDYGGQGGLGDIAFLPSETNASLGTRTIYLTWAEAGDSDTRGAALGRGQLVCDQATTCRIEGLSVIWRQPKVTGRGH